MCAARSDFLADYLVGVQPSRRTLGKGGFAYVVQGKWQGREVAVKYLHNIHMYPDEGAEDDQPSKAYYRFVDEFRTLRDLNHECLVQVYGVSPPPSTRDSHGLVMECLPITLRKRYSNTPHFAIHQEVTVACDVCRGLEYLHSRGILHRDLTTSNIMLTGSASDSMHRAKITDFGLAHRLRDLSVDMQSFSAEVGTRRYMAPETRKDKESKRSRYGMPSDVYSMAVAVFCMCIREEMDICEGEGNMLGKMGLRHPLKELVAKSIVNDPSQRPKASDLCRHLSEHQRLTTTLEVTSGQSSQSHSHAYQEAVARQGKIPVRITSFIPYGDSGSGKSSLCDALQGKDHKYNRPSTRVADLTNAICLVDGSRAKWSEADARTVKAAIMTLVAEWRPGDTGKGPATVNVIPTPTGAIGSTTAATTGAAHPESLKQHGTPLVLDLTPATARGSAPEISEHQRLIAEVSSLVMSSEYIRETFSEMFRDGAFQIIRICDLAGQDSYRTLQDGVTPKLASAYAIVHDAAGQMLSQREGSEGQTNLDHIIDCVDTIYHSVEHDKCAMYVIGTKIDKRRETTRGVQRSNSEIERELEEDTHHLKECLTRYSGLTKDISILFVDNTRKSGLFPSSHALLRKLVSEDSGTHVEVPIIWLPFTLAIIELSSVVKTPWLPWNDVCELALRLDSIKERSELPDLLDYQHGIGFVIHGAEGSPVIVNIDLFIRCVAELIIPDGLEACPLRLNEPILSLTDEDAALYGNGILTTTVAETLWSSSKDETVRELMAIPANREQVFQQMRNMSVLKDIGLQKTERGQDRFMLLPCISKQQNILCSGQVSICLVRPLRACFPLSKLSKVVMACLERFEEVSADTLAQVQMGKTAFRIPWEEYNGSWMNMILRYINCGITVELERLDDGRFKKFCTEYAPEALRYIKGAMLRVLDSSGNPDCVNPAIMCNCQHKCKRHGTPACKKSICLHFAILREDKRPKCSFGEIRNNIQDVTKFWLHLQQNQTSGVLTPAPSDDASCGSSSSAGDPWDSSEYRSCYPDLLQWMDIDSIRDQCFSKGLIDKVANDKLMDELYRYDARKNLLRIISTTPRHFPVFREILRSYETGIFADMLRQLDTVGPNPKGFHPVLPRTPSLSSGTVDSTLPKVPVEEESSVQKSGKQARIENEQVRDRKDEFSADVVPDASEEVSVLDANIQNAAISRTPVEQRTVKRGYSRHPQPLESNPSHQPTVLPRTPLLSSGTVDSTLPKVPVEEESSVQKSGKQARIENGQVGDRTDESSADVVPDASEEVSALVANIQNAAIFGTSVEQCTVKRGYSRHPRSQQIEEAYSDWWKRLPVVGLMNLGNTCFFNSAMQGLFQTYELHEQLVNSRASRGPLEVNPKSQEPIEITLKPNMSGYSMASAMYFVFSEMRSSPRYGMNPGPVHEVLSNHEPKYRCGKQEDGAKALENILSIMRQDELKSIERAVNEQLQDKPEKRRDVLRRAYMESVGRRLWDYTLVDKVFGGELLIKTTCCLEACKHVKKNLELFSVLYLPLGSKQDEIWSGSSCSRLRGGGNRNTKSNTSLSQGACASEVCAQPLSGKEDNDSDQTPVSVDKLSETEGHGASDSRSTCSSDTIPSAHPPGHNGNRSDDSTDLLEGGGKKSKSWVLQPCPKPVNKHSKWLNIGDCLGLFTAEELIQGEHSLCERCAEVQRMHEINSQDEGDNRATPVGGDTRRQVKINRLPQVLIVNLKRFEVVGRRLQKRHDPVETTPELDVAPFCTEECIEKCGDVDEDGKIWYTPFALTSHSGSLHGGHYVAYVKSRSYDGTSDGEHLKKECLLAGHRQVGSQGGWYYVSDSQVGMSSESSALTAQAYTVFYERKRIPGDAAHARA